MLLGRGSNNTVYTTSNQRMDGPKDGPTVAYRVACTRLYLPLCWSVSRSVRPSLIAKTSRIGAIRLFEQWRQSVTTRRAPDVVYTVLLLPLPNSTRLNLPCIRPCYSSLWTCDIVRSAHFFSRVNICYRIGECARHQ